MSDQSVLLRTAAYNMRAAVEQIRELREENRRLRAYHDHTERLLALFESQAPPEVFGAERDVAHDLHKSAHALDAEVSRVEAAAAAQAEEVPDGL